MTAFTIAFGLLPIQQQASADWGGVGGMSPPAAPPALTPTSTDSDGDGIPNAWEDSNFLSKTNPADAQSDFDQDGLTALQEYQLSQSNSNFGKPNGKWAITAIPRPTGFTTGTPSTTLIECASNGIILARVNGTLAGTTSATSFPYIYSPVTGAWTRIPAPVDFPAVASLTPLDVNSSGQVVGYFNSGGIKGFLYTPDETGGQTEVFGLQTGGDDLVAIPKRISDNGYIVGSVGTMGGRSFAGTQYGWEITFPGMSANPVFLDANDYGEFIGTVYNPLTMRTETFLAAEGFPVYFTGISQSAFDGTSGLWGSIPDIDPSVIVWDPTASDRYFKKGTVIDRQTGAVVNVSEGYGASFYWKSNLTYYGGYPLWYSYPGFSSVLGALNDWGEFASLYSGSMSGAYFDSYGSQSSADSSTDSGIFFFDGSYHLSKARSSIFGVSNDPRVLVGTPFALWSGSLTVPIANLIPSGNPTVFASGRIADNGMVVLQQAGNTPIYILKPNQDADNDGMPDDWEKYYGFDPANPADASADPDQDGDTNLSEFRYRTDPQLLKIPGTNQYIDLRPGIDTDGDGIPNTWEWKYGLNYKNPADALQDTDLDELTNLQEYRLGTNPKKIDTDGDGMSDGGEVRWGFNPRVFEDSALDPDNDGLTNAEEISMGTNPKNEDTNGNGELDGDDPASYSRPPASAATAETALPGAPLEQLYVNYVEKTYSETTTTSTSTYLGESETTAYGSKAKNKTASWQFLPEDRTDTQTYLNTTEKSLLDSLKRLAFPQFGELPEFRYGVSRVDDNGFAFGSRFSYHTTTYTDEVIDPDFSRTTTDTGGGGFSALFRIERKKKESFPRRILCLKLYYQQPTWAFQDVPVLTKTETIELKIPADATESNVGKIQATKIGEEVRIGLIKIKEVSFSGEKYHQLQSDDNTTLYSASHWVDVDGDGNATTNTDTGEKNYPVAFTRNSKPKVGAKFTVTGLENGETVKIKAVSAQGLQIPETSLTPADGTITLPPTASSINIPNLIQFHNAEDDTAFEIDWKIRVGNGDWSTIGKTKHTVYITKADPIKTATSLMNETLFNIGCRNAKGKGDDDQKVVDAIYDYFKEKDVQRVKRSSGTLDGIGMTYWGNSDTAGSTTSELLSGRDGACGAWAELFIDVLRSQGIDAQMIGYYPPMFSNAFYADFAARFPGSNPTSLNDLYPVVFVKNWTLSGDKFAPIDDDGMEAQRNKNPKAFFSNHAVVKYGDAGKIYDPSYGSAVFASQAEWEDASVEAFGAISTITSPFPNGQRLWVEKADPKGTAEMKPRQSGQNSSERTSADYRISVR